MSRRALLAGGLLAVLTGAPALAQDLAVRGKIVYTLAGAPLRDGVVLVRDGKIVALGTAPQVEIPPGVETLDAAVVTPGLVDAHSVVGLAGWLNYAHDQDQLDGTDPLQPELRAVDAYDPREPLVAWVRSFGVTTVHTGHAPGAVISGQTLVAKTRGTTVDRAVIVEVAMVAATLGAGAVREEGSPGTRSKAVALLRAELVRAREYSRRRSTAEPGERDLRLEALGRVLAREIPLLVTAHRAHDIVTALRIAAEFEFDLVLDGAAEAYLVADRIVDAGVPVIVHPPMARAEGETENLSFETPATLKRAGLLVALQSGYEAYVPKTRVVLFEAAIAARYGLSFEEALAMVTIDAARILGVDERVGSLEVGKDADFALFDGDPFEYTTHCVGVVIEGEVVSDEPR